jgi:hypothetical protein
MSLKNPSALEPVGLKSAAHRFQRKTDTDVIGEAVGNSWQRRRAAPWSTTECPVNKRFASPIPG